jgi:hypothetical protein
MAQEKDEQSQEPLAPVAQRHARRQPRKQQDPVRVVATTRVFVYNSLREPGEVFLASPGLIDGKAILARDDFAEWQSKKEVADATKENEQRDPNDGLPRQFLPIETDEDKPIPHPGLIKQHSRL